jgi:hypothetical protein
MQEVLLARINLVVLLTSTRHKRHFTKVGHRTRPQLHRKSYSSRDLEGKYIGQLGPSFDRFLLMVSYDSQIS